MENQKMFNTFLSFTLGGEEFAVEARSVVKILEMRSFTKVPQAPPYLKGIINLEGKVVPVFNAYYKFGFKEPEDQKNSVIVILKFNSGSDEAEVGIIVEKANEVFEADVSKIQEYPVLGNKHYGKLITGVIKHKDQFIMILDTSKMFSVEEIESANI